jgi:nucleoside-diphosphate-sugar epimerase
VAVYLITGIAGFIGSALARALLQAGHTVRGIDNFSTGRRENIAEISSRTDLRELDLSQNSAALEDACSGVDFILHHAAVPSVPRSVADPVGSHRANLDSTLHVLMAARRAAGRDHRLKRLVYAASSSAYGETPTLPKREDMLPAPISPYAVSKLASELYMQSFYRVYGLETVCLRYFNVFGPRQDPSSQYSGVMPKFISAMLRHEAPAIYGDGEQTRDFTYVDNVVSANLLACAAESSKVAGQTFNIASGQRVSVNQMFTSLQQVVGFSGQPQYESARSGDILHSLADISRAQSNLGYKVKVDFAEGLRRTVEWYRQTVSAVAGPAR